MKRKYFLIGVAMIAVTVIVTLVLIPYMPERVPSHWNAHGKVDGYSPRWMLPVLMPGIMTLLLLLFAALQWLSPAKFEVDTFQSTYLFIMIVILGLMAYIHALMLWAGLKGNIDISKALTGGVCLMFVALGNVMGKVRRNFYIGIRTPWTIASERVWYATHRFGAKTFVLGGLLAFLVALVGLPFGAMIVIMVAALSPVIYSLVYYKKLEKRGNLSKAVDI